MELMSKLVGFATLVDILYRAFWKKTKLLKDKHEILEVDQAERKFGLGRIVSKISCVSAFLGNTGEMEHEFDASLGILWKLVAMRSGDSLPV